MKTIFNADWQFLNDSCWENVTLPHTPKIEDYNVYMHFQGKSKYRKFFHLAPEDLHKRLVIEFEAIMQYCEITVNGVEITRHYGGYLPIYADITGIAKEENCIEIMADNSDMPDVPPGKPLEVLDFCYFGGIYRNAWLHITDLTHITLPVQKGKTAGGGIFVTYPSVNAAEAIAQVKINVENMHPAEDCVSLRVSISDKGKTIASAAADRVIPAKEDADISFSLNIPSPRLWSPDSPHLYELHTALYRGDLCLEQKTIPIGIRTVAVQAGQFLLNGLPIKLYGTNRHQSFPYVGNAASDEAHYRDAYLLKEMGVNFVRLAHYPQSESFLTACDQLGIMLAEPVPGWQWFRDTELFKEIGVQNAHDMVLRDRNHPSIVFWEATLNETHHAPNDFCKEVVDAIKAEYPGDQCLCSGDTIRKNAEYIGLDISHPQPFKYIKGFEDKKGDAPAWNGVQYYREYGDWNFGGNNSTSRQGREDGDIAMLLSCWNQWHTYANLFNKPEVIGVANWVGIDYNRGYCPASPICRCGALDSLRRKKFLFEMMRSQGLNEPMVFIANHWLGPETTKKIVVFSNCDRVELYINGKLVESKAPANGNLAGYKLQNIASDPYYWIDGTDARDLKQATEPTNPIIEAYNADLMWNGEDADGTLHPYFVFHAVRYEEGCVEAIGYIDGKEVARHTVHSAGKPAQIRIVPDDCAVPLKANDNDFIFVDADILDDKGNPVFSYTDPVSFRVDGGSIIGPETVSAIAGKATIMMKAHDRVTVTAESGSMRASAELHPIL